MKRVVEKISNLAGVPNPRPAVARARPSPEPGCRPSPAVALARLSPWPGQRAGGPEGDSTRLVYVLVLLSRNILSLK